uniref:Uncharacterized protein n=1 Tax=Anguilla anguilla TaxID=7936 RepID=A0A0E9T2I6_ANGAN
MFPRMRPHFGSCRGGTCCFWGHEKQQQPFLMNFTFTPFASEKTKSVVDQWSV